MAGFAKGFSPVAPLERRKRIEVAADPKTSFAREANTYRLVADPSLKSFVEADALIR
jgi:hypothetical protein